VVAKLVSKCTSVPLATYTISHKQ